MSLRLLGITQGSTLDPMSASGLNSTVFAACARHVSLAGVLDISMHGLERYWNALIRWSPNRDIWRERFDLNVPTFRRLSRMAGQEIARRQGSFNVILQLRTLFAPGSPPGAWPYTMLVDSTYALSDRYYPPWAPMRPAEKRQWLELEREAYHRAAFVFARTHWVQRSLIGDYGVPPERAVWVGTGSHYRPKDQSEWKPPARGKAILFVGKQLRRKGVDTLLKAFQEVRRRIPEAELVLVGREMQVQQDGVKTPGKVEDRQRLQRYYEQASVFVLPALFEPCGLVVAEAMAHGLPCIVSDAGGLSEFVEEGRSGYIVPPRDASLLAERLVTLLEHDDLRREMGRNSLERVCREFTWDSVVRRMLPYLEEAAGLHRLEGQRQHA